MPTAPALPYGERLERAAQWLVVATAAAIALPTAWVGITSGLFLLCWVASGRVPIYWQRLVQHPIARVALLNLAWMAVAILWAPVDWRLALDNWWQYREFLIIALMLSVCTDARWGQRILYGFLAGFAFSLLVSYLRWVHLLPEYTGGGTMAGFGGRAGFSVMLAFTTYACLWLWRAAPQQRVLWTVFGLLSLFNLFIINDGRTGQIGFLGLFPLLLFRWLRWRGLALGALGAVVFAGAVYMVSPSVQKRGAEVAADYHSYRAGNTNTSMGLRVEFWLNTLPLITQQPLVGNGTGSFRHDYAQIAARKGLTGDHVSVNPHNEYLLILAQQGVVGLALLLWLWAAQWRLACGADELQRYLTHGLLVLMVLGDFFNSFILDNLEGHLYALLTVALCCSWSPVSGLAGTPAPDKA